MLSHTFFITATIISISFSDLFYSTSCSDSKFVAKSFLVINRIVILLQIGLFNATVLEFMLSFSETSLKAYRVMVKNSSLSSKTYYKQMKQEVSPREEE